MYSYMVMTLEKNRAEFWGSNGAENSESEKPQGFSVSWGKTYWSTIDANGNLTQDAYKKYQWDAANRLISVTYLNPQPVSIADNITFQYDGKGRRVAITEKHGMSVLSDKRFVWCDDQLCQERDSTGATVAKQFFGFGERIGSTNYFFTQDHLGSVREMVDGSGVVQARYDYDPFGRQTKISGSVDSDFGYTGFYFNKSSALNFTWYRAFDSEKGRWLSRDPLEEPLNGAYYSSGYGDANLYRYVENNVMIYVDPDGLLRKKRGGRYPVKDLTPPLAAKACCFEKCLAGSDFCYTGGKEKKPHKKGSKHPKGHAVDFGKNSNPDLFNFDVDDVIDCAIQCKFDTVIWEDIGTDNEHYHLSD